MKTEQLYTVTAFDRNKGRRCNISVSLTESKAQYFYSILKEQMNNSAEQYRNLSEIKIEEAK